MAPSLPPELLDMVVQYLPKDAETTLQNCALVARAWTGPSQRALFHHIDLSRYGIMTNLLAHLVCFPHLQTLIQDVSLYQLPRDRERYDSSYNRVYSTCVSALFRLFPHLMSITVVIGGLKYQEEEGKGYFLEVVNEYLRHSSTLVAIEIVTICDAYHFAKAISILEGSRVKRVCFCSAEEQWRPAQELKTVARQVSSLPHVDFLRLDIWEHCNGQGTFAFWFSKPHMMFPNLKHCEVVASLVTDGLADWLSWFRQPSLLLESFRMEINVDGTGFFCWPTNNHSIVFLEEFYWDVTPEDNVNDAAHLTNVHSILLGLRCAHLQMGIHSFVDDLEPDREQLLLDWWSSSLRTLADSNTTIHFEELTLPFNDAPHVEAVSVAWDALDKVLAHAAFSGVQQVHFEEIRGRIVITDETHPGLTPRIRSAMPRLAGRGVLCFL